jgi:hypothetical protein
MTHLIDSTKIATWISSIPEAHWAAMIARRARPLRELREELKTKLETVGLLEIEPPAGLRPPAERSSTKQATAILGLKPRKLQAMSQRGEIPGAAKLGRQWTYDLVKLRRFVEQQEKAWQGSARPRPGATGAAIPSGAALRSVGGSCGGRLRQMIQQSQKRVAKRAKRER